MMLLNLKGVSQQPDLALNQKSLRSNPTMFATSNQIPPKCRKNINILMGYPETRCLQLVLNTLYTWLVWHYKPLSR